MVIQLCKFAEHASLFLDRSFKYILYKSAGNMNVVCIDSSEHSERAFQCEYIYLRNILWLPIYRITTGGENSTINMNVNSLVFHKD